MTGKTPITELLLSLRGFTRVHGFKYAIAIPNGMGSDLFIEFDCLDDSIMVGIENTNGNYNYLCEVGYYEEIEKIYSAIAGKEIP